MILCIVGFLGWKPSSNRWG
jgi:hypothetical protein